MFKKLIVLMILMSMFSIGTLYALQAADLQRYNDRRAEEGFQIISEFNESLLMRRVITNYINAVGVHEGEILVSLDDNSDESLKEEILALLGEDADLVRFFDVVFTIPMGPRMLTEEELSELENPYLQGGFLEPYFVESSLLEPRSSMIRMGSVVHIAGGAWTVGSPPTFDDRFFRTANHGALLDYHPVFDSIIPIGRVDRWAFGGRSGDSARVNMTTSGRWIRHSLTNLNGFMPPPGSRVSAHTGFSGIVSGEIAFHDFSFSKLDVHNRPINLSGMTMVFMRTQLGDSGSALVSGDTAVGILSIGGVRVNGLEATIFTPIRNIPF